AADRRSRGARPGVRRARRRPRRGAERTRDGRRVDIVWLRGNERCPRARTGMNPPVALTAAASTHAADDAAVAVLAEPLRTRALRAERVTRMVLVAGSRALELAGLAVETGPPRGDVGVVLGTMLGCFLTNAAYAERLAQAGPPGASPRLFAATVSNAAARELAIACPLGGATATLPAGPASG